MESNTKLQEKKQKEAEKQKTQQNTESQQDPNDEKFNDKQYILIKRLGASWSHTRNKISAEKFVDEYYEKISFEKIADVEISKCIDNGLFQHALWLRELTIVFQRKIDLNKTQEQHDVLVDKAKQKLDEYFLHSKIDKDFLYEEIKLCFKEAKIDFAISYIELYYSLSADDEKKTDKVKDSNLSENQDMNFEKLYESCNFNKKTYETNVDNNNLDNNNLDNKNPEEFKKRKEKFEFIQGFWIKVFYLQNLIKQKENWKVLKSEKNIIIKHSESKGIITSQVDAILDIPAYNFLTLVYEMSLYKKFIPFTQDSEDMVKQGRTGKVAYVSWRVGRFLLSREAYLMGFGWDSLFHKGCVVIEGGSIEWNDPEVKTYGLDIGKKGKHTRLDLKPIYLEVYPLEKEKCRVKLVAKADPKLFLIPDALVNYLMKQMLNYCFNFQVNKAKDIDKVGDWKEKMQENSQFYDWMKLLLDKYIENRN